MCDGGQFSDKNKGWVSEEGGGKYQNGPEPLPLRIENDATLSSWVRKTSHQRQPEVRLTCEHTRAARRVM